MYLCFELSQSLLKTPKTSRNMVINLKKMAYFCLVKSVRTFWTIFVFILKFQLWFIEFTDLLIYYSLYYKS